MGKRCHEEPDEGQDLLDQMEQAGFPEVSAACANGLCRQCRVRFPDNCACSCHNGEPYL